MNEMTSVKEDKHFDNAPKKYGTLIEVIHLYAYDTSIGI